MGDDLDIEALLADIDTLSSPEKPQKQKPPSAMLTATATACAPTTSTTSASEGYEGTRIDENSLEALLSLTDELSGTHTSPTTASAPGSITTTSSTGIPANTTSTTHPEIAAAPPSGEPPGEREGPLRRRRTRPSTGGAGTGLPASASSSPSSASASVPVPVTGNTPLTLDHPISSGGRERECVGGDIITPCPHASPPASPQPEVGGTGGFPARYSAHTSSAASSVLGTVGGEAHTGTEVGDDFDDDGTTTTTTTTSKRPDSAASQRVIDAAVADGACVCMCVCLSSFLCVSLSHTNPLSLSHSLYVCMMYIYI